MPVTTNKKKRVRYIIAQNNHPGPKCTLLLIYYGRQAPSFTDIGQPPRKRDGQSPRNIDGQPPNNLDGQPPKNRDGQPSRNLDGTADKEP